MRISASLVLIPILAAAALAAREPKPLPADPRDVDAGAILARTEAEADLDGDREKEGLVLVEVLTGERDPARAAEVILGVIGRARGKERAPLLWSRQVARETGLPAHGGEIAAVDLDGDGGSEIVLTWDRAVVDGQRDRFGEIWACDGPGRFRKVWEGVWEQDTRRDEKRAVSERMRFETTIDYGATRAMAGRGLVLVRTYTVVAGQTLSEPKVTRDEVAARLRP